METSFNPYLKWLGIPLKHQPPTYYRLLGVELFEADADIIERAADRQMAYLRSLQSGEQAQAAQQLLNEISTAKVCLLDPKRKAEYDQRLQQKTQEQDLRPQAAPAVTSGSSIHVAAPPPRRASASGLELRTAQPLPAVVKPAPATGPLPMAAPGAVAASPASARPAAAFGESRPAPGLGVLPLAIAAVAAGMFLLLALVVTAFAFWPSSEDVVVDAGSGDIASNDVVVPDNFEVQVTEEETPTTIVANNDNPSTEVGEEEKTPIDDAQSQTPPPETGGTRPARVPGGTVEMDAQFLLGTLNNGEDVLSDREFVWRNVAQELKGLDTTRWQYGAVESFKIKPEQSGPLYLIVPPAQYEQPAPQISLLGWEETTLSCDVEVDSGELLPCRVYRRTGPMSREISVATTQAAWPIVAVAKINKRTRILGDIVSSTEPPRTTPPIVPPTGGNVRPPVVGPPKTLPPQREPTGVEEEKPPTTTVTKIKVPTSDVQKPVRQKLDELYNIAALKTPEEKLAAAKNLLDVAREPSDKPEERYVMLATSAQLAADSGDLLTALLAVETIDIDYDGDASAMKLHLARLFAKSNVPATVKAQQLAEVLPIIDEAMVNDHFTGIDDLVKELLAAKLRHPELAGRRKIALDMQDTYRKVTAARKTLQTSPDDPTANRVVGEYYCYYKLDWEQGLPYLAKADDASIKDAAKLDAASPEASADQLAVADGWFNLSKDVDPKTDERQKGSMLARAQEWYERAATDLKGLDEAHAKKRLDEVKAELVKLGWVDIPRKAIIVAASGYTFECYLNGERLFSGSYGAERVEATLKRGDTLMFHATKSSSSFGSYSKGFACVIAYEGAQPVATGLSKGWEGFVPSDRFNWYRPDSARSGTPVIASSGVGHQDLAQQTGIGARSLWYAAGNTSEAYFIYRVR